MRKRDRATDSIVRTAAGSKALSIRSIAPSAKGRDWAAQTNQCFGRKSEGWLASARAMHDFINRRRQFFVCPTQSRAQPRSLQKNSTNCRTPCSQASVHSRRPRMRLTFRTVDGAASAREALLY